MAMPNLGSARWLCTSPSKSILFFPASLPLFVSTSALYPIGATRLVIAPPQKLVLLASTRYFSTTQVVAVILVTSRSWMISISLVPGCSCCSTLCGQGLGSWLGWK
ncbi:hypothetical protein BT63DRAFT_267651 [Microthyrium microscopicum]|uniref:Uncharacterized protein n=1 Tax=Microthyrium microscopicum TaxID=703497 RepID=A0A6A6UDT9_9PEZI|nr:hypothetical protein BT63DRAFT_267651 [Microthyrium microscopicum]